jgi:hypothetical protein
MTKIDITPVEQMIANLREENEQLRKELTNAKSNAQSWKTVALANGSAAHSHAGMRFDAEEENERLREVNAAQVHQIDVAHARIDHLEEQLRKAQQREAMRSGVWYGGRIVRSGE